jgi:hypothetical protein
MQTPSDSVMAKMEREPKEDQRSAEYVAAEAELRRKLDSRKKTIGETTFNRGVYTGIGWVVNEIGSMKFTSIFQRSNNRWVGKPAFERLSESLGKHIKGGKKTAEDFLVWAALNFVGCFVVPAIKVMDDHKAAIVKKLNHVFDNGNKSDSEIAARDKEVDMAIACEPSQSWTSLIVGRLAAMTVAIGTGTFIFGQKSKKDGLTGNDRLKHYFDKGASNGTHWVGEKIGSKKLQAIADLSKPNYTNRPQPQPQELNSFHYYAGLAGPETLGCAITSVVLEAVSKYTAKKNPRFKDADLRAKTLAEIVDKKRHVDVPYAKHADKVMLEKPQELSL